MACGGASDADKVAVMKREQRTTLRGPARSGTVIAAVGGASGVGAIDFAQTQQLFRPSM